MALVLFVLGVRVTDSTAGEFDAATLRQMNGPSEHFSVEKKFKKFQCSLLKRSSKQV